MTWLRLLLARLITWASWGACPFCDRHHDPSDHWPLHDDTYM